MTKNLALFLALLGVLVACGSPDDENPVFDGNTTTEADDDTDDGTDDGDGTDTEPEGVSGTENPTARSRISRYEAFDAASGNGYAKNIEYDADTDTFSVTNLGFDGTRDTPYSRDNQVANLGPFAVYEATRTVMDPLSGVEISQLEHKAIYGVSRSGDSRFAIIRTGNYVPYGFGGFVYERDRGVKLPKEGQAAYRGDYAALRDFNGAGGIEYATGTMNLDIDFEDFEDGGAVKGAVTDRAVFDTRGNEVTQDILDALSDEAGFNVNALPTLLLSIGPGNIDDAGELRGEVASWKPNNGGAQEIFEAGNYYAVVSGDDAEEIVGVIVVEGTDARFEDVTVRETGGFILSR